MSALRWNAVRDERGITVRHQWNAHAAKRKGDFNAWMKEYSGDRGLPRLTSHTVVDAKKFRALIEQVRIDDYCVASEEHELGVHALAVPLRNMQGRTVAALNVVASPQRLEAGVMQRDVLPLLLDAARVLRPML